MISGAISGVRTKTVVKPGGLIEVHSHELPEGTTVDVIVLVEASDPKKPKSKGLSRFIGATKGRGSFASMADVDEYIRLERDSWDS